MKARSIELLFGPPPPMKDGTKLLVKVGEEYLTVKADFGGYDNDDPDGFRTRLGRYISPHDIDEYAVLTND